MNYSHSAACAAAALILSACSAPPPLDVTVTPQVRNLGSHVFSFFQIDIVRTTDGSEVYQIDKIELNSNSCGQTNKFLQSLNALSKEEKPAYKERGSKQSFAVAPEECQQINDVRIYLTDGQHWDYSFKN